MNIFSGNDGRHSYGPSEKRSDLSHKVPECVYWPDCHSLTHFWRNPHNYVSCPVLHNFIHQVISVGQYMDELLHSYPLNPCKNVHTQNAKHVSVRHGDSRLVSKVPRIPGVLKEKLYAANEANKESESGGPPVPSASLFSLVEEHELCVLSRLWLLQSGNQCWSSDLSKVTVNYMCVTSIRMALYVKKCAVRGNSPEMGQVLVSRTSTFFYFICTLNEIPVTFWKKKLEDISPFRGATDTQGRRHQKSKTGVSKPRSKYLWLRISI